ncbi:hypothetical protein H6F43_20045 [Leptolyngbya sp. FACHB-36]|uniref:ArnT family glycosyltransferase n=1 Tax=Leptolyngbya sp. FACHB-36 TaxID=2692808 RepID=UPI001680C85B|nr:hypothetical protein [Leptolyngbya sp. FACHB-36]MBD2022475.1 hypothetical protein [Leptolyngbya sp. FACHB-36]
MTKQPKSTLTVFDSAQTSRQLGVFPEGKLIYWLLGIILLIYAGLALNGYGNHDDIYRMIGTWRSLLSEQRYVSSRFQGYLVPELVIGAASHVGSFYLSNLVSVGLAIGSLYIFYRLLTQITAPLTAVLATAVVGSNPFWIIPSVTSTDYVYPAFFFMLGVFLLLQQRFRWAGLLFALAVSSRLTYGPMGAIALTFYFPYLRQHPSLRGRYFQGWLLFLLGSAALYSPVFFASGMTFSFLGFASDTSGGTLGVVARFIYKNLYLWGLPAFIVLLFCLIRERDFFWRKIRANPFRTVTAPQLVFLAVLTGFLYSEFLFARLPHQYQYLIPVLFCVAYFIALIPNQTRQIIYLSLIVLLHCTYAVVNLDIIDTYQTGEVNQTIHSDGAVVKVSLKEGVLVRDFRWRSIYQRRLTEEFNQRWQHFGAPLDNPR